MKLSSREKKMLYILLIVIIFTLGFVGVRICYDNLTAAQDSLAAAEEEHRVCKLTAENCELLKAQLKSTEEEIADIESLFYKKMDSWEAEHTITLMAVENRLTVKDLMLEEAYNATPKTYAKGYGEEESAAADEKAENGYVWTTSMLLTLTGNYDSFVKFIEEINENKATRVVNFEFGKKIKDSEPLRIGVKALGATSDFEGTVEVEIYTYENQGE